MRHFKTIPAVLVLVALVAGCGDSLTGPELTDGPLQIAPSVAGGPPGAVEVTIGSGVETFPPDDVSLDTPPPFILVDGVCRGFHRNSCKTPG